jgi:hypothetical protein
MPKLERWIVASKMVEVLDKETLSKVLDDGGQIGGGWNRVHQHVLVNADNKERIEKILIENGYEIIGAENFQHPEACNPAT